MKKLLIILFTCVLIFGFAKIADAKQLPNGSFEDLENTKWECDLNCTLPVTDYLLVGKNAYDKTNYAYLFHDAGIYQDVTIPKNTAALSVWFDNQSDDEVPEKGTFTISFVNPKTDGVYATKFFDTQSDTWINETMIVPKGLVGKTVRVSISNKSGFNRIDFLEWKTTAEFYPPEEYPTVVITVLSYQKKVVSDALVYIQKNRKRVDLLRAGTNTIVKSFKTDKNGKVPKFEILDKSSSKGKLQLCVEKQKVKECVVIKPENGKETSYDFAFSSGKVQ